MDIPEDFKHLPWSAHKAVLPNLLFVCSVNRFRSPTAEIVARQLGLVADSVGTHELAVVQLSASHLKWADLVICMEIEQAIKAKDIAARANLLIDTKVWNIPDEFDFMDPALCTIVKRKLAPFIEQRNSALLEKLSY
jgi:predicted protein tyrosine phosphatase